MPETTDYAAQEKSSYELFRDLLKDLGIPFGPSVYGFDSVYEAVHHRIAEELSDDIREETEALKEAGVLEPEKFRPCRDAADQIDPRAQLAQALTQNKTP